jgi:serine/threonine protein kinase
MPFIEHDLKTLVETMPHPFSQSEVKTLMKQLLSAVGYCHDRMIVSNTSCNRNRSWILTTILLLCYSCIVI